MTGYFTKLPTLQKLCQSCHQPITTPTPGSYNVSKNRRWCNSCTEVQAKERAKRMWEQRQCHEVTPDGDLEVKR